MCADLRRISDVSYFQVGKTSDKALSSSRKKLSTHLLDRQDGRTATAPNLHVDASNRKISSAYASNTRRTFIDGAPRMFSGTVLGLPCHRTGGLESPRYPSQGVQQQGSEYKMRRQGRSTAGSRSLTREGATRSRRSHLEHVVGRS